MEAGIVFDEEEEVTDVPFLAEQNADVPPAIHHQQGIEEMGWWSLHSLHCHLEMERILQGDCKRMGKLNVKDLQKRREKIEG